MKVGWHRAHCCPWCLRTGTTHPGPRGWRDVIVTLRVAQPDAVAAGSGQPTQGTGTGGGRGVKRGHCHSCPPPPASSCRGCTEGPGVPQLPVLLGGPSQMESHTPAHPGGAESSVHLILTTWLSWDPQIQSPLFPIAQTSVPLCLTQILIIFPVRAGQQDLHLPVSPAGPLP